MHAIGLTDAELVSMRSKLEHKRREGFGRNMLRDAVAREILGAGKLWKDVQKEAETLRKEKISRKGPPNTPCCGDRVKMRGKNERTGTMVKWNPDPAKNDCTVMWDDSTTPMLCHRFELERIDTP